ncbi:unnamed protein product [Arctogadus glacialis]
MWDYKITNARARHICKTVCLMFRSDQCGRLRADSASLRESVIMLCRGQRSLPQRARCGSELRLFQTKKTINHWPDQSRDITTSASSLTAWLRAQPTPHSQPNQIQR